MSFNYGFTGEFMYISYYDFGVGFVYRIGNRFRNSVMVTKPVSAFGKVNRQLIFQP